MSLSSAALVIFDLDGTLANTTSLAQNDRTPARLLAPGFNYGSKSAGNQPSWELNPDVSKVPAVLIERGHRVVVATNSPLPYASTLTHLLGIEHQGLHSNCGGGGGKAVHIRTIYSESGFSPSNVIYVGDTAIDAQIAATAGVHHMTAKQLLSGHLLANLQTPSVGHDETPKTDVRLDDETRRVLIRDERIPFFRTESSITREERELFGLFSKVSPWIRDARRIRFSDAALNRASAPDNPLAAYYRTVLYYALRSHPGQPQRREIQEVLLRNATKEELWDFFRVGIGGYTERFGLAPSVLTRREQSDPLIRDLLLHGCMRMFPPIVKDNLSCVVNYWGDGVLGSLLKVVKDYRVKPKVSGPAVRLGLIDGIADLCAGIMSLHSNAPIVPVPSSPYSADKPGQVSLRLANAVSERVARPIVPLIELGAPAADGTKQFQLRSDASILLPVGSSFDLFDDQITNGGTIQACLHLMDAAGYRLNQIYTYSAKSSNISGQRQGLFETHASGLHAQRWTHMVMRLRESM